MLSATCKYSIRAVIFIASGTEENKNIGLKEISENLGLPQHYLAKTLQILVKRGILGSAKGPHGGFYMKVPPSELTLFDIIEIIDGRNFFDSCYVTGERCNFDRPDDGHCVLHNELRVEKIRLEKFFSSKTIDQLVEQVRNRPPGRTKI